MSEGNRVVPPRSSQAVQQVERVCQSLIQVLQRDGTVPKGMKFTVQVIESQVANAFVLPNGSIFVYTGIFPMAQDLNGLATVLGHELSHAIGHHASEKIGFTSLLLIAYDFTRGWVDSAQGGRTLTGMAASFIAATLAQAVLPLAHSRSMETEADKIGLQLMAKAGYDPEAAANLWLRMSVSEKQKQSAMRPPEFLSTHPSSERRIANLQRWVAEANVIYQQVLEEAKLQHRKLPQGEEKIHHSPIMSPDQMARMDDQAESADLSFRASALAVGEFGNLVRVKL